LGRQTNTGGRAVVLPLVRAELFSLVFHCHRQPLYGHRTAQKLKQDASGKKAAVKQPSVRSLTFKTKLFIATVKKKTAAVPTARAR
jgi:hypothetical protein